MTANPTPRDAVAAHTDVQALEAIRHAYSDYSADRLSAAGFANMIGALLANRPAPAASDASQRAAQLLRWLRDEYLSDPEASAEIDRVCASLGHPDDPHDETPERCDTCLREFAAAPAAGGEDELPAILFDGHAVYAQLDDRQKARTSPENVADVLDAVVRAARKEPTP
jgi:hypothetical protein